MCWLLVVEFSEPNPFKKSTKAAVLSSLQKCDVVIVGLKSLMKG
jgi:hypothetical protein